MAVPELVLHVGLPQSGGRMLARALGQLRRQLHRRGVGLIRHADLAALDGVGGWLRDAEVERGAAADFERAVASRVTRERAAVARAGRRLRALVISSDHLLGRSNLDAEDERCLRPQAEPAVAQMIRAVGPDTTRVVLYVRRQDRLMEACYLRSLQEGASHGFEQHFPACYEPVLDLGRLADRLAGIAGVDAVRVRPFELVGTSPSILAGDLLAAATAARGRLDLRVVDDDHPPYRLYSQRAASIALAANPHLDTDAERRLLRSFLLERFAASDDAGTRVLEDDARERILAAYQQVNHRLFERHMPHLPPDSYDSDEATSRLAALEQPPRAGSSRARGPVNGRAWGSASIRGTRVFGSGDEVRGRLAAGFERELLEHGGGPVDGDTAPEGLAVVASALDAAGVVYLVVPDHRERAYRIVVPEGARARCARALRGLHDKLRLSVDAASPPAASASPRQPGTARTTPGASWRVHHLGVAEVAEPTAGLRIEFWPIDDGSAEQLWRLRWDADADTALPGPATGDLLDIGGRAYPTARRATTRPRDDEVTFPVDVVYTWVDGTDPDWLAAKQAALREVDPATHPGDADDPSRYRSFDELRYSLRSLARYADWVRHVFVVTDGQVPAWLATDHPRLTVVDHRDIFADQAALPTFNSHAIESRLHHIPGLAEHYLYLNDDFFLGRPVTADRFFDANGSARFFRSPARIPPPAEVRGERSVDIAAANTRRLIHERFGRRAENKFKHAPYPQRRSVLFEMEEVLAEEFARTAANRLRSGDDIAVPSSLSHYYAHLTGRAVPGRIASRYVSLDEPRLRRRLRKLARRGGFDVLCINDAVADDVTGLARRRRQLERFMATYWPEPGPFER